MSDTSADDNVNGNAGTNYAEKLRATIDDLEIDKHVDELTVQLETAFVSAREKVATLAFERGDEVERLLDKASASIESRTEGRYAAQVDKVRETVSGVVAKLAEYRPASAPVPPVEEIENPTAE